MTTLAVFFSSDSERCCVVLTVELTLDDASMNQQDKIDQRFI